MPELLPLFIKYADCVGVLLCRYGFKYNILARLATFDYGLSARSVVIIESNADNFCMKIALNDEYATYLEYKVSAEKYAPGAILGEIKRKGL